MTNTTMADKIAMYIGGGLILLAIPVMGIINVLAGYETPLYTYEVVKGGETTTGHVLAPALAPEGAEIVSSPLFDPNLRAYLIALALLLWGVYAIYKAFGASEPTGPTAEQRGAGAAD